MATSWDTEIIVIGAGVVGLSVAAALSRQGRHVWVLESDVGPGRGTTSRNSQVIHAGIYYPPDSLKARLCVRGNRLLYDFCQRREIPHKKLGKLIVACTADEEPALETIRTRAETSGAEPLHPISQHELRRLEPHVAGCAALFSPASGIIDAHELVKALEAETTAHDGVILYRCELISCSFLGDGYRLEVKNPSGTERIQSRIVINAAGLASDLIACAVGITSYTLSWCKGDYFVVTGSGLPTVERLIYPVPPPKLVGLGVHLTLDLAGRMRLGPDTEYISRDSAALDVDPRKAESFYRSAARFLPWLDVAMLQPDTYGIRPKLQGPNDPWRDFVICDEAAHGFPGFINLIGIESPGLTASLAIAEDVCALPSISR